MSFQMTKGVSGLIIAYIEHIYNPVPRLHRIYCYAIYLVAADNLGTEMTHKKINPPVFIKKYNLQYCCPKTPLSWYDIIQAKKKGVHMFVGYAL